jgi:hypothetical protein
MTIGSAARAGAALRMPVNAPAAIKPMPSA